MLTNHKIIINQYQREMLYYAVCSLLQNASKYNIDREHHFPTGTFNLLNLALEMKTDIPNWNINPDYIALDTHKRDILLRSLRCTLKQNAEYLQSQTGDICPDKWDEALVMYEMLLDLSHEKDSTIRHGLCL